MTQFVLSFLFLSLETACLTGIVLLFFALFGKKLTAKCKYILWTLVVLRLCVPFGLLPSAVRVTIPLPAFEKPAEIAEELPAPEAPAPAFPISEPQAYVPAETVTEPLPYDAETVFPAIPVYTEEEFSGSVPTEKEPPAYEDAVSSEPKEPFDAAALVKILLSVLPIVWLGGALVYFIFHFSSALRYSGMIRRYFRSAGEREKKVFEQTARTLGIRHAPDLFVSAAAESPMLIGFVKRTVVLPKSCSENALEEEQLASVFTHELVHEKRGDLFVKFLCLIAESLHWFNPAAHIAVTRCTDTMELSCDECVLSGTDEETRVTYADTMLSIMKSSSHHSRPLLTTGFNPHKKAVFARFDNILNGAGSHHGRPLIAAALVLCVLMGSLVTVCCADSVIPPSPVPWKEIAEPLDTEAPETEVPETEVPETEVPETEPVETEPVVSEPWKPILPEKPSEETKAPETKASEKEPALRTTPAKKTTGIKTSEKQDILPETPVTVKEAKASLTDSFSTSDALMYGESARMKLESEGKTLDNRDFTWHSTNTKVITVSSDGVLTAVENGSAYILAESKDGSFKPVKLMVRAFIPTESVTVKDASGNILSGPLHTSDGLTLTPESVSAYLSSVPETVVHIGDRMYLDVNAEPYFGYSYKILSGKDCIDPSALSSNYLCPVKRGEIVIALCTHDVHTSYVLMRFVCDGYGYEGSGTEDDPYLIGTADDFIRMRYTQKESGLYFRQTADIDLSGCSLHQKINPTRAPFSHTYDGNGYSIRNLTPEGTSSPYAYVFADAFYDSLFGTVENAHIRNLTVDGCTLTCSSLSKAALISGCAKNSVFENCSVKAVLPYDTADGKGLALTHFGGIVGEGYGVTIIGCTVDLVLDGRLNCVGGIAGVLDSASIVKNCTVYGKIVQETCVYNDKIASGGLVGILSGSAVTDCHAHVDMSCRGYLTGNHELMSDMQAVLGTLIESASSGSRISGSSADGTLTYKDPLAGYSDSPVALADATVIIE